MSASFEIRVHTSFENIDPSEWDSCAGSSSSESERAVDPFTTYRFLKALEDSGSIGPGTGWQAQYLTVHKGDEMIAAAPVYGKSHSQGEYIFDFNWAHAYENAGGRYYPKLQVAVPFTPVTGRRLLTKPEHEQVGRAALIQGLVQLVQENKISSAHITFCAEGEATEGEKIGLLKRKSQQFHWKNSSYQNFEDFLNGLSSRKRKNIRKERKQAQSFGGEIVQLTGDQIQPEHWDAFWRFYQDTGARKWGTPYLTRSFFDLAHERMRDDILLVLAIRDGQAIAGALNFIGADALFGRYWGCTEHYPALHFELCYYQAVDYAIAHELSTVEAGAQGEHKLARGYLPVETHSLHYIADTGFRDAVAKFLDAEAQAIGEEIEILTAYGPFKNSGEAD
ncbi:MULTISPECIES: GNAT family N-acetyltransferase [Halocynthiibacter]|uniref:GNAT family N-acetyltransferase n=1 Tax=Halocynthiibacter halioticoli TaxID=2986804 RepID=A0AAE3J168_9RHOB|nr:MULTISPECIES: GNAT family N-acetyltransferase [Halocynthiibacter]MCV6825888.1 GNAT family N-acetyltransferase [Halocynthiibacter halioticoli]MCW4058889.1 GNAT family N-acetyltransferase [Halocynthiibacter sp. SDUM655004]